MTTQAHVFAAICVGLAAIVSAQEQGVVAGPQPDPFLEVLRTRAAGERRVILVSRTHSRLRYYEGGALIADYEVAFGQADGAKELRGDLKTPRGSYHVLHKSKGPFSGDFKDFYGGHWIKLNYPGAVDAERGEDAGLLTRAQANAIRVSFSSRAPTDEKTRLGGGIGFHGWNGDWTAEDGGTRLSWGCIVLHNADIERLYPRIQPGTLVVIF